MRTTVLMSWRVGCFDPVPRPRLLAQHHTLHAHDLIFSAFGKVLWKRVRENNISKNEANATLDGLLTLHLQVQPSELLIPVALEIA